MKDKQKIGISLIVLVITIIVMIILATSIILSLSGSGLIQKAEDSKYAADKANAKDLVITYLSEWKLEGKTGSFSDYAESKLVQAGFKTSGHGGFKVSEDGGLNTIYIGSDNRQAIIPEGFVVSDIEEEDTVTEGLVIYEGSESVKDDTDAQTTRNQFVWVPVDVPEGKTFEQVFARTTKYKPTEAITSPDQPSSNNYYTEPCSKTTSGGITLSASNDLTGEWKEYALMTASVEKNGGFYIGRYEAGTTVSRGTGVNKAYGTTPVFMQKDKHPYCRVAWGPTMTNVEGENLDSNNNNQGKGAVQLSRGMYTNSVSVASTLCYGVQWDAALRFIATNPEYVEYPTSSSNNGNFTDYLEPTGYHEVNNIYDMAGNLEEWTMEAGNTVNRVSRGSYYSYPVSSSNKASIRKMITCSGTNIHSGFRTALYLK